jgi:hypothetical protein
MIPPTAGETKASAMCIIKPPQNLKLYKKHEAHLLSFNSGNTFMASFSYLKIDSYSALQCLNTI